MNVIYLCDKKECGEICPNSECNHTTKIEHAVNFRAVTDEDGKILYYEEKEREKDESPIIIPGLKVEYPYPYKPTCPQGYDDCIYDPAYIQYYHPKWYKDLYGDLTPEEVSKQKCSVDDEYCYDDEDK